jgi:octaprenyl-diphosphate synthase
VSAALSTKTNEQTPLEALRALVSNDLNQVDARIFDLIKSKVSLIPEISEHTIASGGKRLRPMLTLASARMCGYEGQAHIDLAASVEFIHTATLLHDDVVDTSDLRRGVQTANNVWGNKESILVGDFLLGKAFELMGSGKSLEVYAVLSHAAVVISEGEVKQLALTGKINVTQAEYFEVINAKTAELFAAACAIGGIIANRPAEEVAALRQYGMNLGCAFQIVDDALDYSAAQENLGKNIGDDFREKKITLPVIIAYNQADNKGRGFLEGAFAQDTDSNELLLKNTISMMENSGAVSESIQIARDITASAAKALQVFPNSNIKQVLLDILEFVVDREF